MSGPRGSIHDFTSLLQSRWSLNVAYIQRVGSTGCSTDVCKTIRVEREVLLYLAEELGLVVVMQTEALHCRPSGVNHHQASL